MENYGMLCDDFFVDMYVNTELELPSNRDTVLSFFERVQKQYPQLSNFFKRKGEGFFLEEENAVGNNRWVSLEGDRIGCGVNNPTILQEAYDFDRFILDMIPYMLNVTPLDIDSLDVMFALDMDCPAGHDEIVAELFSSSVWSGFNEVHGGRVINFSPSMIFSFSEDDRTQVRVCVEPKVASGPDSGKGSRNATDAISVYFTVRQYRTDGNRFAVLESFESQCRLAEELLVERIVPDFVRPISQAIAQRRLS